MTDSDIHRLAKFSSEPKPRPVKIRPSPRSTGKAPSESLRAGRLPSTLHLTRRDLAGTRATAGTRVSRPLCSERNLTSVKSGVTGKFESLALPATEFKFHWTAGVRPRLPRSSAGRRRWSGAAGDCRRP